MIWITAIVALGALWVLWRLVANAFIEWEMRRHRIEMKERLERLARGECLD